MIETNINTKPVRVQRKPLALLSGILGLGLITTCLAFYRMGARNPYVSKAVGGYRCRYTLSTAWHIVQDNSDPGEGASESRLFNSPPSPIRAWIATYIFHQSPSPPNSLGYPILLATGITAPKDRLLNLHIQDGYPEPKLLAGEHILFERHFRIDGCPATVYRGDSVMRTSRMHGWGLYVSTPDPSYTFYVGSIADDQHRDQSSREMQAILASFHVEKVAVPAAGKHGSFRGRSEGKAERANNE